MKKQSSGLLKKHWLIILTAGILILAIGILIGAAFSSSDETSSINSFAECAQAGYPVQQTFPETCAVPGGQTFVNN